MSVDISKLGTPAFWNALSSDPERLAAQICSINLVNLEETLTKHASLKAWVNAAHETAKINEERAKWELTKTKARVLLQAKRENDPDSGKSKTVAVLEAEVDSNPEVEKAISAYFDASTTRAALRAMADGLEDRKDMLVQLSAKQRQEEKDYNRN